MNTNVTKSFTVGESIDGKCPVCGDGFDINIECVICSECATIHHLDCYKYNGLCATYGCQSHLVQFVTNEKNQRQSPTTSLNFELWNWQQHTFCNYPCFSKLKEMLWIAVIISLPFILFIAYRNEPVRWLFIVIFLECYLFSFKIKPMPADVSTNHVFH